MDADFSWDAMRMTPVLPLLCCWCVVIAGSDEPTPEEQHARFMSRLRGGPKFVDRAAGTGLPTQLPNAAVQYGMGRRVWINGALIVRAVCRGETTP